MRNIVTRARCGDKGAIQAIIKKYTSEVIEIASSYYIPQYEIEDLIQHGFLSIIIGINNYKFDCNCFSSYIINRVDNSMKALHQNKINHYREVQYEYSNSFERDYLFTLQDAIISYNQVNEVTSIK